MDYMKIAWKFTSLKEELSERINGLTALGSLNHKEVCLAPSKY